MNLIRNLIGLIIAAILLPLFLMAFRYVTEIGFDYDQVNDEIAISQLREQMLISYDLKFTRNMLTFRYKNDDFRLSEVNGMLLLQPGTQIYLTNFDEVHFERKDGCIYVCYSRKGQHYERILCKQSGIHIDDFSDCALRDAEHNSGEE